MGWFSRAGGTGFTASTVSSDGVGDGDGDGHSRQLDESAVIIVQRPGEVVFLPAGWFHVVLNVETSTAISNSLTLRRDIEHARSLFLEAEREFALWGQPDN